MLFVGEIRLSRHGKLLQEETLVTVSPCEFPPRGHLLSLDYKMESCDLFQKIIYIVYDIVLLKEISVKC